MGESFFDSRLSWDEYFMGVALWASTRSSCLKRKVGAAVVKDKRVIATGYNGAAPGVTSCFEKGKCYREYAEVESGRDKDICQAAHAEFNALAQFGRAAAKGSIIYSTTFPCTNCAQLIAVTGVVGLVYVGEYDRQYNSIAKATLDQLEGFAIKKIEGESLEKICQTYEEYNRHLREGNFRLKRKK